MRIYGERETKSVIIEESLFKHLDIVANQIVGVRADFYNVEVKGKSFCNIFLLVCNTEPLFVGGNFTPDDGMLIRRDIFKARNFALGDS